MASIAVAIQGDAVCGACGPQQNAPVHLDPGVKQKLRAARYLCSEDQLGIDAPSLQHQLCRHGLWQANRRPGNDAGRAPHRACDALRKLRRRHSAGNSQRQPALVVPVGQQQGQPCQAQRESRFENEQFVGQHAIAQAPTANRLCAVF